MNRGAYVLKNILGTPPPEPPPDVPALPELSGEKLSMRQRMEQHRAAPACAGCHQLMDPIGLILESFDGIGRWRDRGQGQPVDQNGGMVHVLRDSGVLNTPMDLRQAILSQPERFVRTATEKLMTYALGRGLTPSDLPTVRAIVRSAAQQDYRFSALVLGIVESEPFQMRQAGTDTGTTIAVNSPNQAALARPRPRSKAQKNRTTRLCSSARSIYPAARFCAA